MPTKELITTQESIQLPFGSLGISLEDCEAYAETLHVQVIACDEATFCNGIALHNLPVAISGYRRLTVLGREIRGR